MLVLSRTKGEAIVIGPPDKPIAVIVVTDIRGDKVRLGFEAGREVQVNRAEVLGLSNSAREIRDVE